MAEGVELGQSLRRVESEAKVRGSAEYIHNLSLPGMLHGKIVRSPFPHARILSIDAHAARAIPGVRMVITSEDVLSVTAADYYGPAFQDQPVLAIDKVRFIGEPVACVIADDPKAAEEGAALVDVEYDELPAVFDEFEAVRPDAPVVHEQIRPSAMFTDLKKLSDRHNTNIAVEFTLRRGDAEEVLAKADRVFDHTFHTPPTAHASMEPMVSVGDIDDKGLITVHSATQNPSIIQVELARLFGVSENQIRVRTALLGGGFGAKLYPKLEPLAAVSAVLARGPVRIALTMEEQFVTLTRHATTIRLRTAVSSDGVMIARHCDVSWNTGAYADIGPRVTQKTGFTAAGPYDIENVSIDSRCVYTNMPPAGALRGFGVPQVAWAYECQSDLIARELGIDPLEFRRRNLLGEGQTHATGTVMKDLGTEEVLNQLRDSLGWDSPLPKGETGTVRGRGLAIGLKAVITPSTSVAIVALSGDGSCTLLCGTVDMGQGSDTAYAQLLANGLGIEASRVTVVHPDTMFTPYDMGTLGSRSLYHMGNAILAALDDIKDQLKRLAAKHLGVSVEALSFEAGGVRDPSGSTSSAATLIEDEFGPNAGSIIGRGSFTPDYVPPDSETGQSSNVAEFWMVGGAGAEVSVDTDTGALTLERLVVVGDCGTVINPDIVRSQLTGAAIMQMGMTRTEEMFFDHGQLTNPGLAFYKVPGILDLPGDLGSAYVEKPHSNQGPHGAKGVGESGTFAVSPAIANAVHDALGVRVWDLPISDEAVWLALQGADDSEST